jgi:Family of unknown function (DUF6519)
MKGDFSRLRDNGGKGYSRVMMQQGRVLLDSDWNEHAALMQELLRRLSRDLFGPHGGPGEYLGFQIFFNGQKDANAQAAWGRLLDRMKQAQDEKLPAIQEAFNRGVPIIGPGRYYVEGVAVTNKGADAYAAESDDPFSGTPAAFDTNKRPWLAYLDVWEDYVSPEQDPGLMEIALGGPDTCGRAKTMWKVRIRYEKVADDLRALKPTGDGLMSAFTDEKPQPDELCVISPDSQYRGVENQLYRVEIHKGGNTETARYKWSRDNGSIVYPVLGSKNGKVFELSRLGRDKLSSLSLGGWVEYVDDDLAAGPGVGVMAKVELIDKDDNLVTLEFAGDTRPVFNKDLHPLLRRWDHTSKIGDGGCVKIEEDKKQALEDGINISFAKSAAKASYRAGDYWLIPARVATGGIDWPKENEKPATLPPHGPMHSYAPLLLVEVGGEKDCRFKCEMTRTEIKGP